MTFPCICAHTTPSAFFFLSPLSRRMSFLDKMKSGAMAAGDASKRAAQRAKITADITMLEGKVTTAKKEFGLHVFVTMVQANKGEVERLFTETRAKVEASSRILRPRREAQRSEGVRLPGQLLRRAAPPGAVRHLQRHPRRAPGGPHQGGG